MREHEWRASSWKNSGATPIAKRKQSDNTEKCDPETKPKRQRLLSRNETLTIKPHRLHPISTFPNRFEAISSSSARQPNDKHSHGTSSIIAECNRRWVFSDGDYSALKDRVVVVSYNILGVENASNHPDLYYKIPPQFLEWNRRKELIGHEINRYNAGIICFQEVDRFNDLNFLLKKDGFSGVHKARTGDASDGCAIFWKETMFTLLHEENIEFQSYGLCNNVAQLCVLKMNDSESKPNPCMQSSKAAATNSRKLVVGNVHVLFNPKRGDIKLGQVRLFIERAYELSQEWGNVPVIIGGDLNSLPQSAIYQFLASSKLDILVHERRNISGQLNHQPCRKYFRSHNSNVKSNCIAISRPLTHVWSDEEVMLATGSKGLTHLSHPLKLSSAYLGVPGSGRSRDSCGEPLATSYHSKFMGTVDYIWHTAELFPVRVLETVPVDVLRRSAGLPNEVWGSDHLALVCELAFSENDNRT
ncbi:carbon catabolite repressor protein 4 homolog 5 [Euphorbia lathyris]|uniref:carbon catabolite repressor protein 4 homolog 5 n=1 Tax=Euphorbia lathyris TaxID=212925 RepID=UPI0033132F50